MVAEACVIDFRGNPLRSMIQLREVIDEAVGQIRAIHPHVVIGFVAISEEQLRWLRLEVFDLTGDAKVAKSFQLTNCKGFDIVVYPDDNGEPCVGCRKLH